MVRVFSFVCIKCEPKHLERVTDLNIPFPSGQKINCINCDSKLVAVECKEAKQ